MNPKEAEKPVSRLAADLEAQYRRIGISAVSAALRYGGDCKNPNYAPSGNAGNGREAEAA
ncbi:MAG TPA: hypothetical protein VNQ99_01520 [Xanthobacteraceae bacterium]|nr:hypothetical protein [Xanthobacteraceae bacterium]